MQQQDPGYGRYEGSPGYGQAPQSGAYHDDPSDPLQQMQAGQIAAGRIYTRSSTTNSLAGMRLALAIVSICILVPIAGIVFGILGGAGLLPFAFACAAIVLVNAIFNNLLKS